MFLSLLACAIVNWPQSYRKSHEKTPGKTEKMEISGDGATDHFFFWESWYFVMLHFVLSSAIVIQPQNPKDFV